VEALNETVNHIKTELNPDYDYDQFNKPEETEKPKLVEQEAASDEEFGNSELSWE